MRIYEPKSQLLRDRKKKDRRAVEPSCLMVYSSGMSTHTSACSLE